MTDSMARPCESSNMGARDFDLRDNAIESHRALFVHGHGAAGEQRRDAIAKVDVFINVKKVEWRSPQARRRPTRRRRCGLQRVHEHDSGVSRNEDAVRDNSTIRRYCSSLSDTRAPVSLVSVSRKVSLQRSVRWARRVRTMLSLPLAMF
jgi:hypothetical protein